MLKIAQVTDIHIGGEHDGKYAVRDNFEKVIKAIPKDVNMVVITGDVADNNYEENYKYVRDFLDDNLNGIDYVVLGGNHDDITILRDVFRDNSFDDGVVNINFINEKTVLTFLDTSNGLVNSEDIDNIPDNAIVFTHFPLGKVYHEFMKKFALTNLEKVEELVMPRVKQVFCGHFHCTSDEGNIHVAPATQCQIDPNIEMFTPVHNYGYRLIGLENGEVTRNEVIWVEINEE